MIKLFTDNYFYIGDKHLVSGKPCQDYAVSDTQNNAAWAVVADGCSTGGNTDVGARVIALSAALAIKEYWIFNNKISNDAVTLEIGLRQRIVTAGVRQALGLRSFDMQATCIYAFVSQLGGLIHLQGDGVIALKYRDGRIIMSRFDWLNNTPYYPGYDENDLISFIKAHGGNLNAKRLNEETWIFSTDKKFVKATNREYTLCEGIKGITINVPQELISEELEVIAVFSDGVTQISNIDWKDAVVEFMSFKNIEGEFAKRRMIRGIKDYQKDGNKVLDDISYAIIRMQAEKGGG